MKVMALSKDKREAVKWYGKAADFVVGLPLPRHK